MRVARSPAASPYIAKNLALSRRTFLRGAGALLALPLLDSMRPAFGRPPPATGLARDGKPRRMLAICNNLGVLPDHFFPTGSGKNYVLSPYLELLRPHRDGFTVFSGVSHPNVDGGHPADNCFLTAAPHPASGSFRNTISLDQYIAEQLGPVTRFPSLTLGVNVQQGVRSLSWTASGALIPSEEKAADVFTRMFIQGSEEQTKRQIRKLSLGQSILDSLGDQAKRLQRDIGPVDRERLDQYFTSVRELEQRMAAAKEWETKPKPRVNAPVPLDPASPVAYMQKVKLMYDVARLAFETDSTRVIALLLDSVNSPAIELDGSPVTDGYHQLSHHGKADEKLRQLKAIDEWHMRLLNGLFADLKAAREAEDTLFDRTMVLYGSNLGNAHAHTNTNMPTILAGGGFRHGQHLAFDTEHNYPLPNLYVSMLQRMGIETDKFASSTGTMTGLEFA
jgi:hypothetical protein